MKKYDVEITEILSLTKRIEAETSDAALRKIVDMYNSEEIILTSDDYYDTTFEVYEVEE